LEFPYRQEEKVRQKSMIFKAINIHYINF